MHRIGARINRALGETEWRIGFSLLFGIVFPAALTSRMKGCRGVLRELAATEGEGSVQEVTAARNGAKRRTSVGLNGDERE